MTPDTVCAHSSMAAGVSNPFVSAQPTSLPLSPFSFARPAACASECARLPVHLVLCRHSELIDWALPTTATVVQDVPLYELIIYNNGEALSSLPSGARERRIPNVGREAFCHVTHMLEMQRVSRACGAQCLPAYVILAQAKACLGRMANCAAVVRRVSTALGRAQAQLSPRNFLVPLQHAETVEYATDFGGMGMNPSSRRMRRMQECWRRELTYSLLNSPKLARSIIDAALKGQLGFSTGANYIVDRATVLNVPTVLLSHLEQIMRRSRPFPWVDLALGVTPIGEHFQNSVHTDTVAHQLLCCDTQMNHTCLPWLLERFWPMIVGPGIGEGIFEPRACRDVGGGGGQCQFLEGNFAAALTTWEARRLIVHFNDAEVTALVGLLDAGHEEHLVRTVLGLRVEWERKWTQAAAVVWAPCTIGTASCQFDRGNLKYTVFTRGASTPSFAEGAATACVTLIANASVWLASIPHVVNLSMPWPAPQRSAVATRHLSTLKAGLRKVFVRCLQGKMVLLRANASLPSMW